MILLCLQEHLKLKVIISCIIQRSLYSFFNLLLLIITLIKIKKWCKGNKILNLIQLFFGFLDQLESRNQNNVCYFAKCWIKLTVFCIGFNGLNYMVFLLKFIPLYICEVINIFRFKLLFNKTGPEKIKTIIYIQIY